MTPRDYLDLALFAITVFLGIIGWLMSRQVDTVKQDIQILFKMHHQDEAALTVLQVKLAENYPLKHDLRVMVDDIKDYFDERFKLVEQIARNQYNNRG